MAIAARKQYRVKRHLVAMITGEGLTDALAGAQVVVDVPNSPSFEDQAAMEF